MHGLKSIRKSKKQKHRSSKCLGSNRSTTCIFCAKKNVHNACGPIRIRYGWHALICDKWARFQYLPCVTCSLHECYCVGDPPGSVLSVPSRVSPRDRPRSFAVTPSLLEVSSVGHGGIFTTMSLRLSLLYLLLGQGSSCREFLPALSHLPSLSGPNVVSISLHQATSDFTPTFDITVACCHLSCYHLILSSKLRSMAAGRVTTWAA